MASLESSLLTSCQKFLNADVPETKKQRAKYNSDYEEFEAELLKFCGLSKKKESKSPSDVWHPPHTPSLNPYLTRIGMLCFSSCFFFGRNRNRWLVP